MEDILRKHPYQLASSEGLDLDSFRLLSPADELSVEDVSDDASVDRLRIPALHIPHCLPGLDLVSLHANVPGIYYDAVSGPRHFSYILRNHMDLR